MTEQLSSFEGIELTADDESIITNVITVTSNPADGAGTPAPIGSLALSNNGKGYFKHNIGNLDWVTVFTQLPDEFANLVIQKTGLTLTDRIILEDSDDSFSKKYTTLQDLIELVASNFTQGLDFSKRGNINATTVLLTRDGILSSTSGHPIGSSNSPSINSVNISTRDLNTYDVTIFQHEGNSINRTNVAVVSAVNTRNVRAVAGVDFTVINQIVPGIQLGAEVTAGTARDVMVEVVIKGEL